MLDGKVIVVTGGSRGIGRACVLDAVARGARVVFCSRHDGAESRAVERAAARSGREAAYGAAADVSIEGDVTRLFAFARERYGAVHGVVANAAISREQLLVSGRTEDWDAVIDANLTGAFLVARAALRCFLEQRTGGRVVAIGTLSQFGVSGNVSYAVSKGGLVGLTQTIARDYGDHGIAATMVIPGYIETALSATMSETARRALIEGCPQRRAGSAAEVASVVSHLLSDRGLGMNGRAVFVTGGLREVPL